MNGPAAIQLSNTYLYRWAAGAREWEQIYRHYHQGRSESQLCPRFRDIHLTEQFLESVSD